jgi:hypothetical protein
MVRADRRKFTPVALHAPELDDRLHGGPPTCWEAPLLRVAGAGLVHLHVTVFNGIGREDAKPSASRISSGAVEEG